MANTKNIDTNGAVAADPIANPQVPVNQEEELVNAANLIALKASLFMSLMDQKIEEKTLELLGGGEFPTTWEADPSEGGDRKMLQFSHCVVVSGAQGFQNLASANFAVEGEQVNNAQILFFNMDKGAVEYFATHGTPSEWRTTGPLYQAKLGPIVGLFVNTRGSTSSVQGLCYGRKVIVGDSEYTIVSRASTAGRESGGTPVFLTGHNETEFKGVLANLPEILTEEGKKMLLKALSLQEKVKLGSTAKLVTAEELYNLGVQAVSSDKI